MSSNIKIIGRMLNFSNLTLVGNDLDIIEKELAQCISNQSVEKLPVVVDLEVPVDLEMLFVILRKFGLQPIGVVDGVMNDIAESKNIAIFPRGKALQKIELNTSVQSKKVTSENTKEQNNITALNKNMVYKKIIRSGQSINNAEGDLVLLSGVNNGAEAIATGSLHIYGTTHGRIVAGATGDTNASIFCQGLNADLVSVAGVYCTKEDIPADKLGKAVHIHYEEGTGLVFTCINDTVQ